MTLPSLINNYKEKELITRTKKAYSIIQNAILLAQIENGEVGFNTSLFDTSKSSEEVTKNFAKYFNGAKVCPNRNTDGCDRFFYNTIIGIKQNSACIRTAADCKQNSAGECIKDENGNNIPDTVTHTDCATLYFDVNGTKLPNQFGRDAYVLKIQTNKVIHSNWAPEGSESFKNIITGIDKLEYTKF